MAKVSKTYRIESELADKIQVLADKHCEGNATAALEALISSGIAIREVPEHMRYKMYSTIKRRCGVNHENEPKLMRNIIDGLWI